MSTIKTNNVQLGQSLTASQNFTLYQPAIPDGTVRLGNGNSGSVTDLITVGSTGNLTFTGTTETYTNSVTISAASTKTLTLNGGAGSNGLVLDASNNVGIGTTPAVRFTVSNNSSGAYVTSRIENLNTGGYAQQDFLIGAGGSAGTATVSYAPGVFFAIGPSANDTTTPIVFRNNNATVQMTLNASGNLGLGVTPSAWSGTAGGAFQNGGNGAIYSLGTDNIKLSQNVYFTSTGYTARYVQTRAATQYTQENGVHQWYTAPSGTAGNAISFTQAMTLDASGRLIVGNTSQLYGFSGRLYTEASSSSYLPFVAVSSYSGDLGNPAGSFYKYDNNSTTSQVFVRFAINNGQAGGGQINANGAAAAAFGAFSDSRLKENITALPNQLANICALKPSEFDYKDGTGHQIGFIAQEMQEVYPDVVGEGEDGMLTITGWSKTEARLVKAIQELTTRLEALEAQ